ncbi:unnamed protein product [Meganyctiphanes norvegica]|uniref:Methyltransferase FkbM domain-containing protein n=1 Tax=Meganyctiphanes norvegica TaxID=48144 RepID=A0AAV2R6Y4_MEGNR
MFRRLLRTRGHVFVALLTGTTLLLFLLHTKGTALKEKTPNDHSLNNVDGYDVFSNDYAAHRRKRNREDEEDRGDNDVNVIISDEDIVNMVKQNLSLDKLLQGPARLTVKLAADNHELVEHVRKHILIPPSQLPYNLEEPDKDSWDQGQGDLIYGSIRHKDGFFVEAGAFNGEYLSNSLHLEKHLGWTGLLVEANTKQFNLMKDKHRKAWLANACLSTKPYPMQVTFEQNDVFGKIVEIPGLSEKHEMQKAQCIPLLTFMLALNKTTIDYFSLDVEGSEMGVLRTIPFDKLDIKFLSVEVNHVEEGMQGVIDFMKGHNYKVHATYSQGAIPVDVMFIK